MSDIIQCNGRCGFCDLTDCMNHPYNYEPGSDADFDRYSVEVQNGDGYYDNNGRFHRFVECD